MVEIVIKHEAKPSVLWPIETSLEYLYDRTGRPFRALIDLLYRGRFKGNDQAPRGKKAGPVTVSCNALGGKASAWLWTNVGRQPC